MVQLPPDAQPMRSAEHPIPTSFSSRSIIQPPLAAIILNRLAFGPRPGDIAAFEALGTTDSERLEAWLDIQLAPSSIDDSDAEARLANSNLATLNLSREELWVQYNRRVAPFTDNNANHPWYELELKTFTLGAYSERQLNEVLANFWHDHFSVHGRMNVLRSMIMRYDRDVIRPNIFGNFRTMLEAVATSSTMLYYLDNYTSSDEGPNENWARELFELHTMGEEHYLGAGIFQEDVPKDSYGMPSGYVDDDVYEAARAFTGWTVSNNANDSLGDTGQFITIGEWHDRFQKFVLSKRLRSDETALDDGRAVLDRLLENRATAVHVCRKLCRRLVADNPPEALVQSTADLFYAQRAAPDQLKQVVRHIVLNADWPASWGQKVKRPFDLALSAMRASGMDIELSLNVGDSGTFLGSYYNPLGQRLYDWPAPNGYPDFGPYWLSTTSLFKRFRLVNWMLSERDEADNYYADVLAMTPANVRSATALTDFWVERIFGYAISAEERQELISFMAQGYNDDYDLPLDEDTNTQDRLRALVALIMMTPSFQWR